MASEDPMRAGSMIITGTAGLDMSRSFAGGGNSVVATSTHDKKTLVEDSVQ